ncbi:MAG: glycosyltransferase [Candidatus Woesearchaeota archaeon]
MQEKVSIIIPACNEEKYIARTLESVKEQSYPRIETIVVCDSCTDDTKRVASKYKAKIYYVQARKPGVAKNVGASNAASEHYIFLDADTTISKNGVRDIMRELTRENEFGTLKVKPYPKKAIASMLMALKNLAFTLHLYPGSNGLIFCRKSLFNKVGGFDTSLYRYEDGDFTHKALLYGKYSFIRSSNAATSIRRFERLGYFNVMLFWVRVFLQHRRGQNNGKYPLIR